MDDLDEICYDNGKEVASEEKKKIVNQNQLKEISFEKLPATSSSEANIFTVKIENGVVGIFDSAAGEDVSCKENSFFLRGEKYDTCEDSLEGGKSSKDKNEITPRLKKKKLPVLNFLKTKEKEESSKPSCSNLKLEEILNMTNFVNWNEKISNQKNSQEKFVTNSTALNNKQKSFFVSHLRNQTKNLNMYRNLRRLKTKQKKFQKGFEMAFVEFEKFNRLCTTEVNKLNSELTNKNETKSNQNKHEKPVYKQRSRLKKHNQLKSDVSIENSTLKNEGEDQRKALKPSKTFRLLKSVNKSLKKERKNAKILQKKIQEKNGHLKDLETDLDKARAKNKVNEKVEEQLKENIVKLKEHLESLTATYKAQSKEKEKKISNLLTEIRKIQHENTAVLQKLKLQFEEKSKNFLCVHTQTDLAAKSIHSVDEVKEVEKKYDELLNHQETLLNQQQLHYQKELLLQKLQLKELNQEVEKLKNEAKEKTDVAEQNEDQEAQIENYKEEYKNLEENLKESKTKFSKMCSENNELKLYIDFYKDAIRAYGIDLNKYLGLARAIRLEGNQTFQEAQPEKEPAKTKKVKPNPDREASPPPSQHSSLAIQPQNEAVTRFRLNQVLSATETLLDIPSLPLESFDESLSQDLTLEYDKLKKILSTDCENVSESEDASATTPFSTCRNTTKGNGSSSSSSSTCTLTELSSSDSEDGESASASTTITKFSRYDESNIETELEPTEARDVSEATKTELTTTSAVTRTETEADLTTKTSFTKTLPEDSSFVSETERTRYTTDVENTETQGLSSATKTNKVTTCSEETRTETEESTLKTKTEQPSYSAVSSVTQSKNRTRDTRIRRTESSEEVTTTENDEPFSETDYDKTTSVSMRTKKLVTAFEKLPMSNRKSHYLEQHNYKKPIDEARTSQSSMNRHKFTYHRPKEVDHNYKNRHQNVALYKSEKNAKSDTGKNEVDVSQQQKLVSRNTYRNSESKANQKYGSNNNEPYSNNQTQINHSLGYPQQAYNEAVYQYQRNQKLTPFSRNNTSQYVQNFNHPFQQAAMMYMQPPQWGQQVLMNSYGCYPQYNSYYRPNVQNQRMYNTTQNSWPRTMGGSYTPAANEANRFYYYPN